jgi:hypothetical protein
MVGVSMCENRLKQGIVCAFLFSLLMLLLIPAAAEGQEVLENGSAAYIRTGEYREFAQNYSLTVKYVNSDSKRVWVSLEQNGESVSDSIIGEGEACVYTRESGEIFNITLSKVYFGSEEELVMFSPVYQYVDPLLPLTYAPDSSTNVTTLPASGNESNGIPGFRAAGAMLAITSCFMVLVFRRK